MRYPRYFKLKIEIKTKIKKIAVNYTDNKLFWKTVKHFLSD